MASSRSARSAPNGETCPEGGLDPSVRDMVARSQLVCLVVEIPSAILVAGSPSARALLASGGEVVGHSIEEFLADEPPTGAIDLLVAGRLMGYETVRSVKQAGGAVTFHGWVQALRDVDPPRYALVVAWEGGSARARTQPMGEEEFQPVVGTVDRELVIDRISAEARSVLGYDPEDLIGHSLLRLVAEPDAANILLALGQAATSGQGASHRARVQTADGSWLYCSVLVLPLLPPPSAAFAILPGDESADEKGPSGRVVQQIIERLGRTIDGATLTRELADVPWSTSSRLSRLSTRELEIVRRLAAGDRVPTIAALLYVSQSTVRNQLSTVFRKLGVHSQQELIVLLREMSDSSSDE